MSEKKDQKLIPRIDINWYYVEFKDFYLHLPSFSVVEGELGTDIEVGLSNNGMELADLYKFETPEIWLSVILNFI